MSQLFAVSAECQIQFCEQCSPEGACISCQTGSVIYNGFCKGGRNTLWRVTETKISSFSRNLHHWLHRYLSFWQLPVQAVVKISSKRHHFCFFDVVGIAAAKMEMMTLLTFIETGTKWPLFCIDIFEFTVLYEKRGIFILISLRFISKVTVKKMSVLF